jgi:nitroreductase
MDAISAINRRVSVRRFRPDPVARTIIERLLECAVLTGTARQRLAEIRAAHRLKRFQDPATPEAQASADKQRQEALATPVFLIAMSAVSSDENTREEDYAATMMSLANLMIAAESLGLGTYLKTGGVMREPDLLRLAGVPAGFRVVGIVSLGYPAEDEAPRRRRPAAKMTHWVDQ